MTDQPLSEKGMATTGQTTTGAKRTTVLNNRFSHLVFLFGVLLITLLTSGKAMADNYTITLSGSNLTIGGETTTLEQAVEIKTFTLVADHGFKLPEVSNITVTKTNGGGGTVNNGGGDDEWSYDNGTITLGASVDLTNDITVTANGVALSSDATLSALTYANDNISSGAPQDVPSFSSEPIPDITLDYNSSLDGSTITMSVTCTDTKASITVNDGATISNGEATATVTVTAEDGSTKDYVVNFKVANDKLISITAPSVTLSERVASKEDALKILNSGSNNQFTLVTEGSQSITVEGAWTFDGEFDNKGGASNDFTWTIGEDKLTAKKLDKNDVKLTGTKSVTNAAASTDATLTALTYSVGEESQGTVTGFATEDAETAQTYSVELPSGTAPDAEITVEATANDERAKVASEEGFTATLESGEATITFTVTPESGDDDKRTITVNFTTAKSNVATLKELKYKIGEGEDPVEVENFKADGTSYTITLPYTTADNATITLLPVATDNGATITGEKIVTLSEGAGNTTLTVTAADEETTQEVTINFTTAKEKILSITAPTAPVLEEAKNEAEVKQIVDAIDKVAVTSEGGTLTELPITWVLDDEFDATPGKKNSYTWTITAGSYDAYEIDGQKTTGKIEVTNFIPAVTGEEESVTIDSDNPVDKIGNGSNLTTIENDVTISSGAKIEQLTLDNVTVGGELVIEETVNEIVLKDATIPAVTLATGKTTTLSLQSGNTISKITNAGTLILQNAEPAVQALSLAIETRTAAPTNGAVSEVVNNGVFTDNTATIVAVTGDADLTITALPKDQSTEGKEVTLTVDATSTAGNVSYQWQKYSGSWGNVNGTDASLKITKEGNGTTKYRCEVKSTDKSSGTKTTTLYTPAASVTFNTSSGGGDNPPSTPTYTVKLAKVTGATFSKGESTTVNKGSDFSFTITLDEDYDQSKPVVTVDGKAIEANADGSYTIKNIQEDTEIVVTGIVKNTATGTEDVVADATRVWSSGSTLYIHTPEAATAYIFSGNGALQRELRVIGDQNLQLRAGFYIVRIGDYSAKVIIR